MSRNPPEVPDDIAEAFEVLNKFIRERKEPVSWYPGNIAVQL